MTTKELVQQIATRTSMTKVKTEELLNATVAVMQKQLLAGKSVPVQNFGTLEMRVRPARVVVHPSTGEKTMVPEKMQLTFKPQAAIKEQLKNA